MPNATRSAQLRRRRRDERRDARRRRIDTPPHVPRGLVWQVRIMDMGIAGIAILLTALGLILLSRGLSDRELVQASRAWPIAPGIVRSAEVVDTTFKTHTYEPRITYSYIVAGATYWGNTVRVGGVEYRNRSSAEAKLAEYPVGLALDVRYDPDVPSRAVLEPGGGGHWRLAVGEGLVAGGAGAALLAVIIRDVRARLAPTNAASKR